MRNTMGVLSAQTDKDQCAGDVGHSTAALHRRQPVPEDQVVVGIIKKNVL